MVVLNGDVIIITSSWWQTNEWMNEWVEFNAPLDTIQVISEAELMTNCTSILYY